MAEVQTPTTGSNPLRRVPRQGDPSVDKDQVASTTAHGTLVDGAASAGAERQGTRDGGVLEGETDRQPDGPDPDARDETEDTPKKARKPRNKTTVFNPPEISSVHDPTDLMMNLLANTAVNGLVRLSEEFADRMEQLADHLKDVNERNKVGSLVAGAHDTCTKAAKGELGDAGMPDLQTSAADKAELRDGRNPDNLPATMKSMTADLRTLSAATADPNQSGQDGAGRSGRQMSPDQLLDAAGRLPDPQQRMSALGLAQGYFQARQALHGERVADLDGALKTNADQQRQSDALMGKATEGFAEDLAKTGAFKDPKAAADMMAKYVEKLGPEAARKTLTTEPGKLGELTPQKRLLGKSEPDPARTADRLSRDKDFMKAADGFIKTAADNRAAHANLGQDARRMTAERAGHVAGALALPTARAARMIEQTRDQLMGRDSPVAAQARDGKQASAAAKTTTELALRQAGQGRG